MVYFLCVTYLSLEYRFPNFEYIFIIILRKIDVLLRLVFCPIVWWEDVNLHGSCRLPCMTAQDRIIKELPTSLIFYP